MAPLPSDAQQRHIDFLVTDWNMPGMTGIDLLRHVRADEKLKHCRC
jgi:two-component system chemotaxis response regulator CheY